MLFFDLADFGEQESDLREAFFFCGSSEFRIHGSPFTIFTGSSHFQVFCSGLFEITDEPEPQFGMGFFIGAGFSEKISDLAGDGRILFCFCSKQVVFHMSLGFSGEGSTQVFFCLCAGEAFHFF